MTVRSSRVWFWRAVFLAPTLALFAMYFVYPLGFVFVISTLEWNGITAPVFVGVQNYLDNFQARQFQFALRNNFVWVAALAVGKIALAALVAMILARQPFAWRLLRTVYFVPVVISQVAIAMMWRAIYNAEYGIINQALERLGAAHLTRNWLGELATALPAILTQEVFYIGYFMIIILAYAMTIPESYYDAAQLDGANVLQQERYITLPMLKPILITTMTLATAFALRHFEATFLLTDGGPAFRTTVLGLQLYKMTAALDYGHANATGGTLVLIGLALITLIRTTVGRRDAASESAQ
ncbi:MAG: sugar ABC transporter permease [Spirochaetaceae bacterium]|nr:sugar ABC transporter permease [Spirochaetaceae bacterium]